ncbi:zinc ABC transporter substrate-binding protein [Aestuariivirga litoralis]|uniref:High-affinity zinc uptake system protein ZnuA n=1 Tax=Aestuariivirga litoralis TaxID=2650924 RepID=A0A2W2BT44_9HYPH|nr:zinc ABC transporter substrate-binding protein [Aestuariivirga litoralis]PZF78857.1 zinc ABC transporter substrate-binding protein [Aestuariivirga litoralis]
MRRLSALLAATLLTAAPGLAAPKVVASVVPLHSIVASVMGDAGTPELLLQGSMSEHRAVFTPAQIAMLGNADLVFIVGHGLEAKLAQISGSDAVNGKRFVELSDAPGVRTLPVRQGGAWEAHDHAHEEDGGTEAEGHDHDHAAEGVLAFDPHVWLDPDNAKAMARQVADDLSKADPANAAAYAANAQAFATRIDTASAGIAAELAPVKDKPFIVFHDAYQYFEKHFGLSGAGSISDVSAQAPSAERLAEVRNKIIAVKAACVFREPQFDGKVVAAVTEGTGAREGVLDPLGAGLTPGPDAYQQLLANLSTALKDCLGS